MRFRNSAVGYGTIAQSLHWLTVVLVAITWMSGTFDDMLPKGAARAAGSFVHIAAGMAIVVVLAVRLLWRLTDPPPKPAPTMLGAWLESAARLAHYALYALLVAVPFAGIVLQFARGEALPLFGLGEIPSPWVRDRSYARTVKEVHETLANALVLLAAFHAAAALVHHWVLRDRTLVRMLPDDRR
jgi:cytochrome b561